MHKLIHACFHHAKAITRNALLLLLFVASSTAFAEAPTQPGSLRYDVYSSTAAEVFWARSSDDTIVVGYEVQINEDVLGTFDVLSYYTDTLVAGTEYNITVTAIDSVGDRSTPASVSFIGGDRDIIISVDGPASPANLQASVYSKTSAEIMWDRPSAFGLTYEVSRNDESVTTTDGTSYYDDELSSGNTYVYKVVAIDPQGGRSAASEVSLTTRGDTTPPLTAQLATPTGLTGRIYSSRSLEIMWDRPSTFGLSYEITRNDAQLLRPQGLVITIAN